MWMDIMPMHSPHGAIRLGGAGTTIPGIGIIVGVGTQAIMDGVGDGTIPGIATTIIGGIIPIITTTTTVLSGLEEADGAKDSTTMTVAVWPTVAMQCGATATMVG